MDANQLFSAMLPMCPWRPGLPIPDKTSQDFTTSGTLAIASKTNVTGIIDAGSANGNHKIAFTIPNGDLDSFDDGLIYAAVGNGSQQSSITTSNGAGLVVDETTGTVQGDDFSWAGASTASVSVTPKVTLSYDTAAVAAAARRELLYLFSLIGAPSVTFTRGCVHINDFAVTEVMVKDFARTTVSINDFAVTTVSVNDEAC